MGPVVHPEARRVVDAAPELSGVDQPGCLGAYVRQLRMVDRGYTVLQRQRHDTFTLAEFSRCYRRDGARWVLRG